MGSDSGSEFNIFTRWYYSWKGKRLYNKQINNLPYVNVKHPISGEVICLGDLFCESLYDCIAIKNILEGYGIKYLGNAIDPTASPVVETLAKMGKNSHFIDGFGKTIGHNDIMPEIMPSSNLGNLKDYVLTHKYGVDSLAGHVAETKIFYHLNENGILTEMPDTSNAAGYDLKVEKSFFDTTELPYVKAPDSELGVLQVKNVAGPRDILEHFKKYPEIPVVCPDDVIDDESLSPYRHLIRGFKEAGLNGIDRESIVNETHQVLVSFKQTLDENFPGIVPVGADIDIIRENIEGYYGCDLPDSLDMDGFEVQIPYLGAAIVFALNCKKNYSLYKAKKISLLQVASNVSGNTALNAIGTMGGAAAGLGVANLLGYKDRATLFDAAFSIGHPDGDFGEIASREYDFDFDDACEIAALVATIGCAWYGAKNIKRGIKAAYKKIKVAIFGDPEEAFKNAKIELFQICLNAFEKYCDNRKLIYNALGGWIVDHHQRQKNKLKFRLKALKSTNNTIELSFLKYVQNKTSKQKEIPKANIFDDFNNSLERCSVLIRFFEKPNPENIKAAYSAKSRFYCKDICTAIDTIIQNLGEKSDEVVKDLVIIEVRHMTSILERFFKAGKHEQKEGYVSDIYEVLEYCEQVKLKHEAYMAEYEKLYGAQLGKQ